MILPAQLRAARALVNWSQTDLAKAAGLSEVTIKNLERGGTDPRVGTMRAITDALERAGVVFVAENGGGAGVRLFKEPLIGWKQCAFPFPGDPAGVQNAFERLFMEGGAPQDAALFARTSDDFEQEIYLASPAARRFLSGLSGEWVDAVNPSLFRWSLLVGHSRAPEWLGIRLGIG